MSSKVEICNMAIAHCRGSSILNLNEGSTEAENCKLFYDSCRKNLIESYEWRFTNKVAGLALLTEEPDKWAYSYAYPSDCLSIRRLIPEYSVTIGNNNEILYRNEYFNQRELELSGIKVPYEVAINDDGSQAIWTNETNAYVQYDFDQTNTGRFPQAFVVALAHLLASYIAVPIMGNEAGSKKSIEQMQKFEGAIIKATANNAIEQYKGKQSDSEMIRCRG